MYKVDIELKKLIPLTSKRLSDLGVLERFDLQEWIEKEPDILGEELLVVAKELSLSSGIRLDLLAVDKKADLVVIELKRDSSGRDVEWQAIKYASYCSNFTPDEILEYFAKYSQLDDDDAQQAIEEFIDGEIEQLNQNQRIILVAQEFHSDVASAVLWLRDFEVEIKCIRLRPYVDSDGEMFITPDVIIPLPEAKDYIERKEAKQKEAKRPRPTLFSLEKGDFELAELEQRLRKTLDRQTDLTPRLVTFFALLLSEDRPFDRAEIKQNLNDKGIGETIGQTGTYLSNISLFLTRRSYPHLRQVIEFETGGRHGDIKDNYQVVPEYRELLQRMVDEWNQKNTSLHNS